MNKRAACPIAWRRCGGVSVPSLYYSDLIPSRFTRIGRRESVFSVWSEKGGGHATEGAAGGSVASGSAASDRAPGKPDYVRMRWGLVPSWWPKALKELREVTLSSPLRPPTCTVV